jgi:hypothetical protein
MKRNLSLTLIFVALLVSTAFAQVNKVKSVLPQPANQVGVPTQKVNYTGFEAHDFQLPSVPAANRSALDIVGETVYDLQSNGGVGRRVQNFGNDDIRAVFTFSSDATAFANRGTGYNTRSGGEWGPPPTARLEPGRTGFTNYVVAPDGTEYTFAHGQGPFRITYMKRAPGAANWTAADVPTAAPSGVLWSRAAIGGNDGQTLHVIASTTPTGNGGVVYQGMDGVMLYSRSLDGGATWDIRDLLLPDINSDNFTGTDVEGYSIDANGNTVAIMLASTWNDCLVWISEDNGTSWTKYIVNDFPFDKYVVNTGYDPNDLPFDPNAPVPEAIFTSDGTSDVLVDNSGIVHVWYGTTYVNDVDVTDAGWVFYPGSNIGIVYWNSTMGENEGVVSGYCPDIDLDGEITVSDISNYGLGLNTHASSAIDQDGNLYLIYSSVNELYVDPNTEYNYRQPFIVASTDNGLSWNLPKQILHPDLIGDDGFDEVPFLECIFNTVAKHADDKVHATFQADYTPLTFLNSPAVDNEPTDNTIRYVGYPTAWALVNTKNVPAQTLKFEVSPNPAHDRAVIQFSAEGNQTAFIQVYDMYGKVVHQTTRTTVGEGVGTAVVNTASLPNGIYFVRLNLGNAFATRKLSVQH